MLGNFLDERVLGVVFGSLRYIWVLVCILFKILFIHCYVVLISGIYCLLGYLALRSSINGGSFGNDSSSFPLSNPFVCSLPVNDNSTSQAINGKFQRKDGVLIKSFIGQLVGIRAVTRLLRG